MKVNTAVRASIILIDVSLCGQYSFNGLSPGIVAVSAHSNYPNSSFCCKKHKSASVSLFTVMSAVTLFDMLLKVLAY